MPDEDKDDITGIEPSVLMAALSYIGVLVLFPLFSGATRNSFVRFHATQGLVILIGEIIALIASFWLPLIGGGLFVIMLAASVAGLFRALQGDEWAIPGISIVASLFSL